MKVEIKNRFTGEIIICGEYESIKDCLEKNKGSNFAGAYLRGAYLREADLRGAYLREADLGGADLRGADLVGAYLRGADLRGAYLGGADLRGAKNYSGNHDIFIQLIRNHSNKFNKKQQEIASRIFAFRLCWGSIKNEYKKEAIKISEILSKLGWDEYEIRYKEELKNK